MLTNSTLLRGLMANFITKLNVLAHSGARHRVTFDKGEVCICACVPDQVKQHSSE